MFLIRDVFCVEKDTAAGARFSALNAGWGNVMKERVAEIVAAYAHISTIGEPTVAASGQTKYSPDYGLHARPLGDANHLHSIKNQ